MPPRILVIGATGLLGGAVARRLQDAGFPVRVMTRDAARARGSLSEPFEIVEGDALSRSDVERAIAGCGAVHVSIDHDREDEGVAHVVEAARARKLERITYVSGTTVCEENRWFPLVSRKLRSEEAIRASGIGFTIFCPGWFIETLPRFVRHGRAIVFGRPRRLWRFVATQDFARMVVESYRRPEALGKRLYVHGPELLTVEEALRIYCRARHPEIRTIHRVPIWMLRLIARLGGREELRRGVEIVAYLEKVGERGDATEANAILGGPRVTLEQWLRQEKAA